ncbi:radical SAM protein, partial [bacterium]|nr:radical SAM protein [bacterium]
MGKDREMRYIFGPVPSRRLGISLGVDLVPYKTCTFNCIYCQLGRTTNYTLKRKEYIKTQKVLKELKEKLANWRTDKLAKQKINYITLSGSGEPTLNVKIGEIISGIKKMTSIPVAVLTNGSLLYRKEVRDSLKKADLVIPSLDAASAKIFKRINRPVKTLKVEKIIKGLVDFEKEYRGKIWLEIMLVKGINDRKEEIEKLKRAIAKIKPDRVQLNTVARPPCEKFAKALSKGELEKIKNLLGPPTEVIVDFERGALPEKMKDLKKGIMTMLKRRPATVKD